MSVQNHWRMYFSFAAENICSISWILPTGKITFHIFFDIFFIFQKLAITGKEKTDLDSFPFFGPTGKTSSARLSPRAQAATWAWAGKLPRRAPPAWAARGPVHPAPLDLIRRPSDCFGRIKNDSGRGPRNPSLIRHLPFFLFALSQRRSLLSLPCSLFSAASEPSQTRASGGARRASMAPPPAPSPACALPSGWARRRRAAWPRWPLCRARRAAAPVRRPFFSRAGERPLRLFFSRAGEGGSVLGLGLGFVRRPCSFPLSFLFFLSFLWHPNVSRVKFCFLLFLFFLLIQLIRFFSFGVHPNRIGI